MSDTEPLYTELPLDLYEEIEQVVNEDNQYANKKQFIILAAKRELESTKTVGASDTTVDVDLSPVVTSMQSLMTEVESIEEQLQEVDEKVDRIDAGSSGVDKRIQRIASMAQDYIPLVESTDEFLELEVGLKTNVYEQAKITGTVNDVAGALEAQEGMDVELNEVSQALSYLTDSVSRVHTHQSSELGRRYYEVKA